MPTHTPAWRRRLPLAFAVLGLGAAVGAALDTLPGRAPTLHITGGAADGHRNTMAQLLAESTVGLNLEIIPTDGSVASLEALRAGRLDAALVQGGLSGAPGLCQLAPVALEPLHVLLAPSVPEGAGLSALRGRRLNLSTARSGTRPVAEALLAVAGLGPGDYLDSELGYSELESLSDDLLPEVIFTVSPLPSPVVEGMVRRHGYRLMDLPYGEALHLRVPGLRPARVPAGLYGIGERVVPPVAVETVGPRLLLVARCDLAKTAVNALLDALVSDGFVRQASPSPLPEAEFAVVPEHPIHPDALAWMRRNDPAWTGGDLEWIESLRSLLGSLGLALFFGWRWLKGRRMERFERYIGEVAAVEQAVGQVEAAPGHLDLPRLLQLRAKLGRLKAEALARHAAGELEGAETLSAFLTQVADARHHVSLLILHERDRQEDAALAERLRPAPPADPEPE